MTGPTSAHPAAPRTGGTDPPQAIRHRLDEVDRAILRILANDARISNKDLADRVAVAPSTCLARVRLLRERGVIRGFRADIDPRVLGRDLQAMIAVRLHDNARAGLEGFADAIRRRPEVLDVWFLAGADDFLLHVGVPGVADARRFVAEHLSRHPAVAHTETSLVFAQLPGAGKGG